MMGTCPACGADLEVDEFYGETLEVEIWTLRCTVCSWKDPAWQVEVKRA